MPVFSLPAACALHCQDDTASLSAATSYGTSTINDFPPPAYHSNSTTYDKIDPVTSYHPKILPTTTTSISSTNDPSVSSFPPSYKYGSINPRVYEACFPEPADMPTTNPAHSLKALLVNAESEAKTAAAGAARGVERAQGFLDAHTEYSKAVEHQRIDAANRQADLGWQRTKTAEAKKRVDELFLTPDKERDLHYEINVRPPSDPKYRKWYWVSIAEKVAVMYSEATEVYDKAIKALESAEAKVKASEECLRAIAGLQTQASQEFCDAVRSAEVLGAASAHAEEEAALLAVRVKEAEDGPRAEAEAAKFKQEEEKAAASKEPRTGLMVLSSDNINASRLNTLWAVVDAFDECNAS